MHLALARKYRPRAFADLIGQEHVARALRGAVEQGKVAHGYLLCGPRGVGKTTAARILAMALNCETRHAGGKTEPGEPCGTCPACERIWAGSSSLDVIEIDAASNRGVDDARDLRERAMYAASQEGRHKIYIVDEAHMLTREAWNTLLKVLEEPPPRVVFVFATTEPMKITNTAAPVMSRLQRFDFRRVGPQAIADRLGAVAAAEGIAVEADAVALIARVANGGLRDALSVLDQVTAFGEGRVTLERVRDVLGVVGDDVFAELLGMVLEHRSADVFPFVARLAEAGVDAVVFAEGAGDLWRAALAARLGAQPEGVSSALGAEIERRKEEMSAGDLLRILKALEESELAITRGTAPRLALELLLVRWTMMDRTVEIAEVLRGASAPQGARGERPAAREKRAEAPARAVVPQSPAPRPQPLSSPQPLALTLASVRAQWSSVLDALRADKKMIVAEALAEAEVADVSGTRIAVRALSANPLVPETIVGKRAVIEAAAARVFGMAVQIALHDEHAERSAAAEPEAPEGAAAGPGGAPQEAAPAAPAAPRRLTVSGARAERTRSLRGKDAALDSAMDALDLELLE